MPHNIRVTEVGHAQLYRGLEAEMRQASASNQILIYILTCDLAGCLSQVDWGKAGASPEVEQLLSETIGDTQPLQLLRRAVRQSAEQRDQACPRPELLRVQITCSTVRHLFKSRIAMG